MVWLLIRLTNLVYKLEIMQNICQNGRQRRQSGFTSRETCHMVYHLLNNAVQQYSIVGSVYHFTLEITRKDTVLLAKLLDFKTTKQTDQIELILLQTISLKYLWVTSFSPQSVAITVASSANKKHLRGDGISSIWLVTSVQLMSLSKKAHPKQKFPHLIRLVFRSTTIATH